MTQRHGYGQQGYSDDYRKRHAEQQQAERKAQDERVAENARLRTARLKALEDERVAQRVTHEERIIATFEPRKQHAKRQWLFDNADKTPEDFERDAWPLLRENWLIEADPGIVGWRAREAERQASKGYGGQS